MRCKNCDNELIYCRGFCRSCYSKEYRKNNLEKLRLGEIEYREKNKDRIEDYNKNWRIKNTFYDLITEDINKIFQRDMSCVYCNSIKSLSLDHIIPVSKGGDTTLNNMVLACRSCNSSKSNKDVFVWCRSKNIIIPKIILDKFGSKKWEL